MSIFEASLGYGHAYAGVCLQWLSWGGLLLFGLPMLLVPLRWARLLGWQIPDDPNLAIYFGRTLGMVSSALAVSGLIAAQHPVLQPFYFNLTLLIFLANTGVHAWGALMRIQPPAENWEIPYWFALAVLVWVFYPDTQWHWY